MTCGPWNKQKWPFDKAIFFFFSIILSLISIELYVLFIALYFNYILTLIIKHFFQQSTYDFLNYCYWIWEHIHLKMLL